MTKRKTLLYFVARATMTLLVMLLTTATAWADGVDYIDENGVLRNTATDDIEENNTLTVINSSNKPTEIGAASTTTWCIVTEDVGYVSPIKIIGDVHFIIAADANMNIENIEYGIYVTDETSSLYIYGQATDTSILTIKFAEVGIRAKNVSIISGNVSISNNTRGISANNIDIYGGSVTFTDSDCSIFAQSDINIYGGSVSTNGSNGIYSKSGDITIKAGTIVATGTEYGICAEGEYSNNGYRGNITINGGDVTVTAVGEGSYGIDASEVTITGGTVTATGDDSNSYYYSGIHASKVTITGGTVTATGDDYGISTGEEIIINGGTIEATGDYYGIYSSDGRITITGGSVTTTGGISTDSSSDITITGGKVTANGKEDGISSSGGDIIISGGDITAISTSNGEDRGGIWTFGGDIKITDGTVTATATGNNGNGIISVLEKGYFGEYGGTITISGGTVIANGNNSGIYAKIDNSNDGTITLSGGSVFAKASDENLANSYRGNVIIADELTYSDGTNTYVGLLTLNNDQKTAIAGKGMHPVKGSYTLVAKKVNDDDDYYWTTFYCGDAGYSIEDSEAIEGDDAYAYTATYNSDNNNIVLHSLGTNIPKGTAVIIVSSSSSVSLSKADNLGKFSGSNDLRGVDVATSLTSVLDTNEANALLMLSNKNGNFGFHDVALTNVPARKAFLPIDDPDPNPVRSFNIVFEDDDTTGINAVNNEERIGNDAWYDLQGRKIQMPTQRGLYIHNGKKIVVK